MAPCLGGQLPLAVVILLITLLKAHGEESSQHINPEIGVHYPGEVFVSQKNGHLLLNCSSSKGGVAQFNYTWLKNDVPVADVNPKIRLFQNGSLYIKKFRKRKRKSDEGVYTCIIKDSIGSFIAKHVRVQVASVDKNFLRQPQSQVAYVGGSARFECAIKAFPSAMFVWQKEQNSLPQDENKYTHLTTGVLHIHNVQTEDTGQYRCISSYGDLHTLRYIADSDIWRKSADANLTVKPAVASRASVILPGNTNVTILKGETAILECLVDGAPMPTVTWSRLDMKPLDGVSYQGNKNLKIKKTDLKHAGVYVCTASSPGSSPVTSHSTLTVNSAPVITKAPISQRWPRARTVKLDCEAEAHPEANIRWYHAGKEITKVQPFDFKDKSLVIYNVEMEHAGYYQCVAENSVGWTSAIAKLVIWENNDSPKPPTGLKATALSDTQVFIQWNKSVLTKDLPIITYVVTLIPEHEGSELLSDFVGGTEDILNKTVDGLKPFTRYKVYVMAFNKKGASPKSKQVIVQTKENIPLGAPEITLTPTGTNQIRVEWKAMPPSVSQGEITQYKIYYRMKSTSINSGEHVNTVAGSKTFFNIKDVEPNREYQVRVLASTKKGFPSLSEDQWPWVPLRTPKMSSTFPIPSLNVNRLNASTVKVSWEVNDPEVKVTNYEVVLRNLHTSIVVDRLSVSPPTSQHTFFNLENGTQYEVTVEAKGDAGESSGVVGEEFRTVETSPTLPAESLRAKTINPTTLILTWTEPDQPHHIKFYEICYNLVNIEKNTCISSMTSSIKVSGLTPFASYTFIVRTHFMNKDVQTSLPYTTRTDDDLPSAPTNITYIVVSPGTVELHWKPPVSPNGVITSYIIFYNNNEKVPDTMWRNLTQTGEFTRATVQELTAASYYFKLSACTRAGQGRQSPIIIVFPMKNCNEQVQHEACDTTTASVGQGPPSPQLGIIVGVTIGIVCILICLVVIIFRNRCFKPREEIPRCHHGNGHIPGYGNGHAVNVATMNRNSMSLPSADFDAMTPMLTMPENADSDSKGGGTLIVTPNGVRVNGLNHSFQNGHLPNGHVTRVEDSAHLNDSGSSEEHRSLIAAMLAASTECSPGPGGSEMSPLTGASLEEIDGNLEDESHPAAPAANGEAAMLKVTQQEGGGLTSDPGSNPRAGAAAAAAAAASANPSLRNTGSGGSAAPSSTSSAKPRSKPASRRDKGQGHVDRPPTPPPPLPCSSPCSTVCSTQESPVAPGKHVDSGPAKMGQGQLPHLYVRDVGTLSGVDCADSVV